MCRHNFGNNGSRILEEWIRYGIFICQPVSHGFVESVYFVEIASSTGTSTTDTVPATSTAASFSSSSEEPKLFHYWIDSYTSKHSKATHPM